MNETMISIAGNVATDLRFVRSERGTPLASFRLASTARRYDRSQGGWVDGRTTFVTVVCWRSLAENVAGSLRKGEPVVVMGRLRVEPWQRDDGRSGTTVEVEAQAVGHDLSRGTSAFRRTRREHTDAPSDNQVAEDLARSWEATDAGLVSDVDETSRPGIGVRGDRNDAASTRVDTADPAGGGSGDDGDVGVASAEAGALPTRQRGGGRSPRAAAASAGDTDQRAA